jgi:serine/threonine-protein kinase
MKPTNVSSTPLPAVATVAYQPPAATRPRRCRIAGSWATGSQYHEQVAWLLLGRLRTVALILLLPLLLFFVRDWIIGLPLPPDLARVALSLRAVVLAVIAGLAVLVWLHPPCDLGKLRAVELTLFMTLAAFLSWKQWCVFANEDLFRNVTKDSLEQVRTALLASGIGWFLLIILYGVFIPNTWKRCALLVGAGTVLPLIISPLSAHAHQDCMRAVAFGMIDMTILLLTAFAVAVFGSYRLQVLQKEAFEAQQLGQYRLKRLLGTGGMGNVFLAEHVLLRRPCAIKLIRAEQAGDPANLQRFEREVQAMATLTHWNTVEVFDYGHADDGTFYYVMEYLPGQTLENLAAKHGPLPPARAIHFLRQVCAALREAHGIGLLHRDVKPSNVIACTRGGLHDVAKLLDFGLVQDVGLARDTRLTVQGTVLGSPPYLAPEQAAGKDDLDARADLYGVGGVGYFLLTGQTPFVRDTAMQMLLAHAYETPVPLSQINPDVPADLEAVLLRCLSKRPEDRYPDADSLDKALAACQDAGGWTEEKAAAWWAEAARTEAAQPDKALAATVA